MFILNRKCPILISYFVLAALIISISSTSGYSSISITLDLELVLTDSSIMLPTATATTGSGSDDDGIGDGNGNGNGNGGKPTEPTEPTTAQRQFIPTVATTTPPPVPSPTSPHIPTPTLALGPTLTPTQTLKPAPLQSPRTIMTNFNNVSINNVQNFEGAVKGTPDCATVAATILLGPSAMEYGGARILAAFDPCVLTDGTVLLNLPDEQGIQLVAANIQGGQTTQSALIPLQRIAPIAQGQVLFGADLNEQVTGPNQARGESATLDGNINALFLLNNSGQAVEFGGDHSVALNTFLRR
jgi:hypothetical protein